MRETYKYKDIYKPEQIKDLFFYDPESGILVWKERGPEHFSDGSGIYTKEWKSKCWNSKNCDHVAGTLTKNDGYIRISLKYKEKKHCFLAHVLVWAWNNNCWPENQIDHDNGNRSDNRIENLFDRTHKQNHRNRKLQVDNTSGFRGISWDESKNRYKVYIGYENKLISLGSFGKDEWELAVACRLEAEEKLGFNKNHGRK